MATQEPESAFAKLDSEDPPDYQARYKPFLLDEKTTSTDWVSELELDNVIDMAERDLLATAQPLRILVLYGSLRKRYDESIHSIAVAFIEDHIPLKTRSCAHSLKHRSYSKLMAFEASRILHRLGCDVRVFDPAELPVKNEADDAHPKVQELRELSLSSDGQVWCTPEQHGNLVGLPLSNQSISDIC